MYNAEREGKAMVWKEKIKVTKELWNSKFEYFRPRNVMIGGR